MKTALLVGGALLLSMSAGAAADLSSLIARMPAYPATPLQAGAAFGGKSFDAPITPKAIENIQHDLMAVNAQPAPSAAQTAAGIQTSQDIAARMQSMTQEQRIAYAMQLQAQMAPPTPRAMALDANGVAMAKSSGQIMQQSGQDQQALNKLQMQATNFANNWKTQDSKITGGEFRSQLCTEGDRASNRAYLAPHLALASQNLTQGVRLERQIRAIGDAAAGRNAQAVSMQAGGGQGLVAFGAASGSSSAAQSAIMDLVQLYDSAGLAAKYQHMADFNDHAKVMGPCHDYGGG